MFNEDRAERVPPCDSHTMHNYNEMVTPRGVLSEPVYATDALVAATARAVGAAVATRDIDVISGCCLDLIDPWAEQAGAPRSRP